MVFSPPRALQFRVMLAPIWKGPMTEESLISCTSYIRGGEGGTEQKSVDIVVVVDIPNMLSLMVSILVGACP